MLADPVIEVRDLVKRYPRERRLRELILRPHERQRVEALAGLSLEVQEGTVHGLLGENGAGKTTLLKVLATLVLPSAGTVRIAGCELPRDAVGARRRVGWVTAEERSFYWRLSGRHNLEFYAALHDMRGAAARRRVQDLVELVGLGEGADRPFREYSSGMKQRLAIARGLLGRPRVVLMDEPTRSLDPRASIWIRRFVRDELVGREGVTVVLATHDLTEAETTCDRLTLVDRGRIVADGTAAELKRPLEHAARTRVVLLEPSREVIERCASEGLALEDAGDSAGAAPHAVLHVGGDEEEVARVVERLVRAGARVTSVEAEAVDLSELFERVAAQRGEHAGSARNPVDGAPTAPAGGAP